VVAVEPQHTGLLGIVIDEAAFTIEGTYKHSRWSELGSGIEK